LSSATMSCPSSCSAGPVLLSVGPVHDAQ
jgi:hypothetical protein